MMRSSSCFRLSLVLVLLAAVLTGCSRDPNVRKQKYYESGERYFEKAKYREAAIQYSNAIQVDPRFAQAHYHLALAFLKIGEESRAYQELNRTLELQPENYEARIDITNLLIAAKYFKEAQEHLDILLSKQPNNPSVHMALANLKNRQGDLPGALAEMQKAIALAPNRSDAYLNYAIMQTQAQQFDAAEANFKKAIALDSKAMSAQLALGGFYQSRGRLPEAEEQFKHAITVDPKDPDPRSALARLYMMEGNKSEAESFLEQTKKDLSDNPTGYRMLGDFYFAVGDLDKAVAEYGSIYHDHPRDLQGKKNYIQLLILKNRLDEARKLNDEILKANSQDNEALIYRGQIQLRDGHVQGAVASLQAALKSDPDNGVAHYHLGLAYDQLGDLSQAETEWRDAVRLKPDLMEAQRALAAVSIRKGDWDALNQIATTIIQAQPMVPDGYGLRSVADLNLKQYTRAEQDINKAIEVAPQNPIGYIQMGNLRQLQKQYAESEKSYLKALDIDPSNSDALNGLMTVYIAQKLPDKAVAAANAQIAKVPNRSAFYDLLGTALFNTKKDYKGAEAALRKAAELDKKNSDALLKLGQVFAAEGSLDQAISTYQQSVKDNPGEISFYILLGEMYDAKHDWDTAKGMYQKALQIQPDNPLASNNLAYVMLQQGGNVDVALSMAQTARRLMPDSPNAADTLGWAYYKKGLYPTAIDLFKEALKKSPNDPTFHYHLGLAYQAADQPSLAKEHLQQVLKLSPNYNDADGVKKALAELHG
jgi:cellulose synthase operon protein C